MNKNIFYNLINSYFDKVFILTIEEATARHRHIREHLQGINYEFIYGVNKAHMCKHFSPNNLSHLNPLYNTSDDRFLIWFNSNHTYGIGACSEGHKIIYQRIIQNKIKRVLIFEDDVVLDDVACAAASSFFNKMPSHWDLLYLGYTGGVRMNQRWPYPVRLFLYHAKKFLGMYRRFDQPICRPYNASFDTAGFHAGAYAYAITFEAAKKLVSVQSPLTFSADGALIFAIKNKLLKAYIHKSPLFTDATYFNTAIKLPSLLNY